ncbi:hypothetical protein LY78DRAFT_726510, partial [Colletotrichum sublineola]
QTRRKPGNDGHTLPYEQGVRCQQFFRSGAASSWFEVLRRVSTSPWLDVAGPNTTDAETNPRLQAPQQGARAEDQEGQEVQGSKAADTPSQAQPPARATSEHEIITQIRQEEKAEQARLVRIEDATAKAANLWRPERARQAESGPGRDDKASAPSPLSWLFPRATKRQRPGSDQEDNPGRSDNNTAEGPTINSTSQAAKRTRQGRTASSAAGDQEGAWSSTSPWAQPDERASLSQCRPIIKRTIAALWAWEDGVLAKALMAFMQQSEGIDLLEERQVRAWFEKMLRVKRCRTLWLKVKRYEDLLLP